jgi:hypothetical protein
VRSAFSKSLQTLKKINPSYSKGLSLKINIDFGAYIDVEYRFNTFTLKWKIMPRSDIGTVVKRVKRILRKR